MSIKPPFFLVTEHLCKSFGGLRAVDDASIRLSQGDITLIIGPNGSGKTTLINCISGFHKPDEGKILYNGTDITDKESYLIVKAGLVKTFQIPEPFHKLTVFENLLVSYRKNSGEDIFWGLFKSKWLHQEKEAVDKALEILELLKLEHLRTMRADTLSGGQLKLLELGKALMTGANMIILDEPVGSINPILAHEIFSHILKLRSERGVTFLIVEHRIDIAMQYVEYVYAMDRGKIISEGKPSDIIKDPGVKKSYLGG